MHDIYLTNDYIQNILEFIFYSWLLIEIFIIGDIFLKAYKRKNQK